MNEEIIKMVKNLGIEEKQAKTYLSCLLMGEASVKDIAHFSKMKRTSVYNFIESMLENGLIYEVKHNKKVYYSALSPKELLLNYKKNLNKFEESLDFIEEEVHKNIKRQKVSFLHGSSGFREVWNKLFKSKPSEYRIMTEGAGFFDYVTPKYVVEEIIQTKKKLGIRSMQIIPESKYAKEVIVPKDGRENRVTKFLPAQTKLDFTEIICSEFVAYISHGNKNSIFLIEDSDFVDYRKKVFDLLWCRL